MGKITKGLTLGAIIGFIAGLFLAPGKGEETRKKAQEKASELYAKGKEKYEEIKKTFQAPKD